MNRRAQSKLAGVSRTQYLRGRLLQKRRELVEHLASWLDFSAVAPSYLLADAVDMASSTTEQETSCRIGSVEAEAVAQIDHALQKLENGTYGACEECGRRIPQARLRVLPFASLCVQCKERLEPHGSGLEEESVGWEELGAFACRDAVDLERTIATVRGRNS